MENRPTYLLLAGNNTVPISTRRVGGMPSTECLLAIIMLIRMTELMLSLLLHCLVCSFMKYVRKQNFGI